MNSEDVLAVVQRLQPCTVPQIIAELEVDEDTYAGFMDMIWDMMDHDITLDDNRKIIIKDA